MAPHALESVGRVHFCHVTPTFAVGGREVRMAQLMAGLPNQIEHTIVALDGRTDAAQLVDASTVVRLVTPGRLGVSGLSRLFKSLAPDLILTYNWGAIEGVVAGAILSRVPVVHMEDGFSRDEAKRPKLRRALARAVILRFAQKTVVPSHTLYRLCRRSFLLPSSKLSLIPNGIDVRRFDVADSTVRVSLGEVPDDVLVLATVGRIGPEKNIFMLLDAFNAISRDDIRLLVVGDGECRVEAQEYANRLSSANRIQFVGQQLNIDQFYRRMDLFVLPSLTEQMPMVLLEAMAAARPVVCSDVGDCRQMLGRFAEEQIVAPGDMRELVCAIRRLLDNPTARRRLGAGNQRRCREQYDLGLMISRYHSLYHDTLRAARKDRLH